MKLLSAQQKSSLKVAGLATVATALISFTINKLVEIELNFWMLIVLLVIGIGVFVYLDLRGSGGGN